MKANAKSLTVKIPVGCPVVHLEHKELKAVLSVFFNDYEDFWEVNIITEDKNVYQNFIPKKVETK